MHLICKHRIRFLPFFNDISNTNYLKSCLCSFCDVNLSAMLEIKALVKIKLYILVLLCCLFFLYTYWFICGSCVSIVLLAKLYYEQIALQNANCNTNARKKRKCVLFYYLLCLNSNNYIKERFFSNPQNPNNLKLKIPSICNECIIYTKIHVNATNSFWDNLNNTGKFKNQIQNFNRSSTLIKCIIYKIWCLCHEYFLG